MSDYEEENLTGSFKYPQIISELDRVQTRKAYEEDTFDSHTPRTAAMMTA